MNVRINNENPTSAQKRALKRQVSIEFNKLLDGFIRDVNIQIYYVLHFEKGYGEKRLRDFAVTFNRVMNDLVKKYEMDEKDKTFLCELKLKQDGIDVDELLKEE